MRVPVSCFIITLNEARRLQRTIRAVKGTVDEIIVIDCGSTDGTPELAAAEGARVIHNDWPGFGRQKQFGQAQCRNDWILNIDADEVVTPELLSSMRRLFLKGQPDAAAYGFWVQDVYPGQAAPRWLAGDNYCLRLYDRTRAGFTESVLHDSVDPTGQPVGHLAGCVHHFSYGSIADLAAKCDARADFYAAHTKRKSPWMLRLRLLTEFPLSFLKYYLGRRHVTGGWTGLRVAAIAAWYRCVRVARTLRRQKQGARRLRHVSTVLGAPGTPAPRFVREAAALRRTGS